MAIWADWGSFILALAAFFLTHLLPARFGLRDRLIGALGRGAYFVLYSLVSLATLSWVVLAAGTAPFIGLWDVAPWQALVPNLVMPVVCLLLVFGLTSPNPLSLGAGAGGFDAARPGIAGITRHPVLWAALLWALAHIVPNGDLAHVVVFGLFALLAFGGMLILDRRARRRLGAGEWQALAAATSLVPFAALLRRRAPFRPRWVDLLRLAGAAALYATLLHGHEMVIGVSPFPMS